MTMAVDKDPTVEVRRLLAAGFLFSNIGDPSEPTVILGWRKTRTYWDVVQIHGPDEAEAVRYSGGEKQKEVGGTPEDVVSEVIRWPMEGLLSAEGF